MILPYVYKLTHKETDQFYIGYRCSNKVIAEEDIGYRYHTSSKVIKSIGIDKFDIEIIAMFFKAEDAYEFEQNLIKENFSGPLCLNRNYNVNGTAKYNTTGMKLTEETKQKMSVSRLGKKISEETKKKISASAKCNKLKGELSPNYGRKRSEETKLKMSLSKIGCKQTFDRNGIKNPNCKRVLVNGIEYDLIREAAITNNCNYVNLVKTLRGKLKLGKKIWQAEYINKEKE